MANAQGARRVQGGHQLPSNAPGLQLFPKKIAALLEPRNYQHQAEHQANHH